MDVSLLDRLRAWRDAKMASPAFQRWAADFPLTRLVAARRARGLFDITAGFVYSQILFACVELDLFDKLAERPRTAVDLAPEMDMSTAAAERLLRAAVAIDLLERRGTGADGSTRFGLGKLGIAMPGNPGIAAMVRHHRMLYHDLDDPLALFRGGLEETELGRYWSYAGAADPAADGDERIAQYSTLMSASSGLVAEDTLDAYSLRNHRCLMDVGGGEGRFLMQAGARWPHLQLMLFDLPAVVARAEQNFIDAGMAERVRLVGGDIKADGLPTGADVISLVRVILDHNDDGAMAILRAVRQALPLGGTLLVTEPMSETPGAEPVGDAYFGLYLLAMGSGRTRPPREHQALLARAGFGDIRLVRTRRPLQTRVIVAKAA
ncbi:MAG: acetylserotonin O-methyltransferase [Thiohalocapsa sp.]|uniref:methyltransferase n=1 Tax=Thiohalocapsa sp. TaxID=2497641 RepID=UPI0025D08DB8|nr:methyltransferase [Thiohalocapsa sp.]MCG6939955.1 acetylserotonin O-methyltransferase [Thiohalocapsa sp.]